MHSADPVGPPCTGGCQPPGFLPPCWISSPTVLHSVGSFSAFTAPLWHHLLQRAARMPGSPSWVGMGGGQSVPSAEPRTLVSEGTVAGILNAQRLPGLGTGCPNLALRRRNKSCGRSTWEAPGTLVVGLLDSRALLRAVLGGRRQEKGLDSDQGASKGGSLLGERVRNPSGQALAPGCSVGAPGAPPPPFRKAAAAAAPPSLEVKCPDRQSQGVRPVSWRLTTATSGPLGLDPLGQGLPYGRQGHDFFLSSRPALGVPQTASGAPRHLPEPSSPRRKVPLRLLSPNSARASAAIEMQIFANCRPAKRLSEPDPSAALTQTFCR